MQTITHNFRMRLSLVFFFFCLLYGTVIVRLYILQIAHHEFYLTHAQKQYTTIVTDLPERGHIYDRHGIPLALNTHTISSFIMPNKLKNPEAVSLFLQKYFPERYTLLEANPHRHFLFITRNMSQEEKTVIQNAQLNTQLEDIKFLQEPDRYYPNEASAAVIGHTNIDNQGAAGIEYIYNNQLQGQAKIYQLEQDARRSNFYFKKELKKNGSPAQSITLTLDAKLQTIVHHELTTACNQFNAQEGAVIILNPDNGDILVMTCFGPNQYKNITLTDAYEFGSVMKIFAALAALESNAVTLDTIIDCQNTRHGMVHERPVNTVTAHDKLPFIDVIARSNNIGIATVMHNVGTKLYDHLIKLGFGKKIDLNLPGQQAGYISHPNNWSAQSLFSLSYGYEITANLLQLAQAFSIIANDGLLITPHIIAEKIATPTRIYKPEVCQEIKTILKQAVTHGTARRAYIPKVEVMCKTGTANLVINGAYDETENIFTCAGIVKQNDYRRVIVTFVKQIEKKGQFASTVSVPLFKNIAQQMLIAEHIVV